jgi:hypothetical protein
MTRNHLQTGGLPSRAIPAWGLPRSLADGTGRTSHGSASAGRTLDPIGSSRSNCGGQGRAGPAPVRPTVANPRIAKGPSSITWRQSSDRPVRGERRPQAVHLGQLSPAPDADDQGVAGRERGLRNSRGVLSIDRLSSGGVTLRVRWRRPDRPTAAQDLDARFGHLTRGELPDGS